MKILFTADLHSIEEAFVRFAELVKEHDIGVIAGDLQHHILSEKEIAELLGVSPRQLGGNYNRFIDAYEAMEKNNEKALGIQELKLQNVLNSAGKPIVLVKGNHDFCKWESQRNLYNINQTTFKFHDYNFVGYQWTHFERGEILRESDCALLADMIDKNTILVTHAPPHRILDAVKVHIFGVGPDVEYAGCKAIRHLVDRKPPRLHLFGHIHEGFGIRGIFINGSYLGHEKFISIDIDSEKFTFTYLT